MSTRYRQIAAQLREAIQKGDYPPGTLLPTVNDLARQMGVARMTVNAAQAMLAAEGLVQPIRGTGTIVLEHRPVRVELSRYGHVLTPGGQRGPWETACDRNGIPGRMVMLEVMHEPATAHVAHQLGIAEGAQIVRRTRHATIGRRPKRITQVQHAYYDAQIADGTPLAGDQKIKGGVYATFTELGRPPATATETVTARRATDDETAELRLRTDMLLAIERVTKDARGHVLELLQVLANPATVTLVYDNLPLTTHEGHTDG